MEVRKRGIIMSHYAIIKGVRLDIEWRLNGSKESVELYKQKAIDEDKDCVTELPYSYQRLWKIMASADDLESKIFVTGDYIEWEGIIDFDILREGIYVYVPSLESHHLINKVEVNVNGVVTYHIDHSKVFYENGEKSRVKAVEEWFAIEYPQYDSYIELLNHRDDVNQYLQEYNEFIENKRKQIEFKKQLKTKYNYEKSITLTDSSKKNNKSWLQRLFD